jgi:EAL domain-containing protein (putative c-di-GMP-specific phosphodiesterase class I)
MRQALKHGGFYLAYQPILGIAGESLGLEALLRWDRPGHRPVSPADVIVEAERNGLIVPLGNWVLHEACRQAAKWSQQVRPVRVSVNLSPRQLDDPSFIDGVAKVLDQTGLNPAYLQLEITESILLHGASAQILRDLRALGVGTVLDDFGTGYSSLSYLKMFDLDSVKIDKTFVDGVGVSQTDTAIVQAVVLIARALGIQVIAEGVEEPDQLRLLRELGCDAVQGYVASRPLPDSGVGHLLRRWQPGADLIGIERLAHPDGSRGAFLES